MKLDKAIEKLIATAYQGIVFHDKDYVDALKLLIEAGKAVQKSRTKYSRSAIYLLPGETEDEDIEGTELEPEEIQAEEETFEETYYKTFIKPLEEVV